MWKSDADLAGVRDAQLLLELPADERASWQGLWADVDAVIARTETSPFVVADRHRSLKQHAAAARSYAEGMATSLIPERDRVSWRYKGASSAAQAGSGLGDDDPKPDADALRRPPPPVPRLAQGEPQVPHGKDGLRTGQGIPGRQERVLLWKGNDELACVREPDALAKLPEADCAAWQAFWAEVDAMQARAEARAGEALSQGRREDPQRCVFQRPLRGDRVRTAPAPSFELPLRDPPTRQPTTRPTHDGGDALLRTKSGSRGGPTDRRGPNGRRAVGMGFRWPVPGCWPIPRGSADRDSWNRSPPMETISPGSHLRE